MTNIDNAAAQNGVNAMQTRTAGETAKPSEQDLGSWYEAMADAWGNALDDQAGRITSLSDAVAGGQDNPSTMTLLTAESLRMQFLANNASTSTSSVGKALESLARKQ